MGSIYKLTSSPLSKATAKKVVNQALSLILESTPEAVYLFGSAARGGMTTASDIDLAIIFETLGALKRERPIVLEKIARKNLGVPVDLLFFTKDEFNRKSSLGGVCMVIKDDGKQIYRISETAS